jgi:phosphohistidine phosphatase
MDLYIVRHAWAVDRGDPNYPDDDLRPLTAEGKRRFADVVAAMAGRGLKPEIIAASPLIRCAETARILAAGTGKAEVVTLDELRPGSDIEGLLRWTARQSRKHERIAWVGHSPDVDRIAAALIGSGDSLLRFAKGAIATVRFDDQPALGIGELQWLVTAKALGIK